MSCYGVVMLTVLDAAVSRARGLSPADQSLVGGLIFAFADDHDREYRLTARQIEEVKLTQQSVREGNIASDKEVFALWKKFGV